MTCVCENSGPRSHLFLLGCLYDGELFSPSQSLFEKIKKSGQLFTYLTSMIGHPEATVLLNVLMLKMPLCGR